MLVPGGGEMNVIPHPPISSGPFTITHTLRMSEGVFRGSTQTYKIQNIQNIKNIKNYNTGTKIHNMFSGPNFPA